MSLEAARTAPMSWIEAARNYKEAKSELRSIGILIQTGAFLMSEENRLATQSVIHKLYNKNVRHKYRSLDEAFKSSPYQKISGQDKCDYLPPWSFETVSDYFFFIMLAENMYSKMKLLLYPYTMLWQ